MNSHFTKAAQREASMEEEDPLSRGRAPFSPSPSSAKSEHSFLPAFIGEWMRKLLRHKSADASLKEVLEEALEEHSEEAERLAPQEKTMLRNVLSFGDMTISHIMTPRMDIFAVPDNVEMDALKAHILENRHTRIPVYHETLDRVEGFLHIKDLFPMIAGDEPYSIKKALRPMLFVPPSMRITDLLVKMRRLGSHMAIVVDEYGGTDGLVTLEDVFEEIVGDIQDEHDDEQDREISHLSEREVEADARIRIDKLEDYLGLSLRGGEDEAGDFDTLGGMIFHLLGQVPEIGTKIDHPSGVMLEVTDADARRVKKVKITNVEPFAVE